MHICPEKCSTVMHKIYDEHTHTAQKHPGQVPSVYKETWTIRVSLRGKSRKVPLHNGFMLVFEAAPSSNNKTFYTIKQ